MRRLEILIRKRVLNYPIINFNCLKQVTRERGCYKVYRIHTFFVLIIFYLTGYMQQLGVPGLKLIHEILLLT